MKRSLLFLATVLLAPYTKAQLFSDNFDLYNAGDYLGVNSGIWTTWSGATGGALDVTVTNNNAQSAPNSIYFASTASGGGPQDVVLPFMTTSVWADGIFTFSADFYVNNNKGAYFNFQGAQNIGSIWALNVDMTQGTLSIDDGLTSNLCVATYPQAAWFNLTIEANLTLHVWKAYIDNQLVGTWLNGINTLASLDIYPLLNHQFYVDNVFLDHQPYVLPNTNAAVAAIDINGNIAGLSVAPSVFILNSGQNPITSFDLTLNYNGQDYVQNISGVNIASTTTYEVTMPNMTLVAGSNIMTATLTNVNGGVDEDPLDDALTQSVDPVVPAAGKIVVGEEATGTWCQWCPRGAVFMDKFANDYPGFWAGIAVHNGDPMVVSDYDAGIGTLISGYPSALVDRMGDVDPSQMSSDFFTRLQTAPKGVLTNGATWDPVTRILEVSVSTEMMQATTGSFKVACVLTEDDVTGSGSGYNQSNAYAGGNNGVMGGFESLPNPVPAAQMVYDHVARAIAPSFSGQTGIIPASTSVGENFTANFSFTLPSNWDETQMHIVGMLIDPQGKIDNAGYTTINQAIQNGYVGGLEEITSVSLEEALIVAPNPATDFTEIAIHVPVQAPVSVHILDAKGSILQARQYGSIQGDFTIDLNTSKYAPGLYIVEMQINAQRIQKKLIIR